jgi:UDP-N-acetylmuramate--alanine ligase
MKDFAALEHIHFIGIGGIGISAVARMLILEGKKVSGSDRSNSEVTEELKKAGATIFIGHAAENIPAECQLVVYTVAIPTDNPELAEARNRGIPLMTYPETLRVISSQKYTIAISGTHGKTTTTAMIASIMLEAGLEPTVIVGSLMKDPREPDGKMTNFIAGTSKYFIVEADEYRKSFHNLEPSILVINNIDEDHLDFYKDLADIQASFHELALRVPKTGFIITNTKNPHIAPVLEGLEAQIIDYVQYKTDDIKLSVPGEHNRLDAAAAMAVAKAVDVPDQTIKSALLDFAGTWRRFEYKGETKNGALVYDDYAHNPMKVQAAIQGARELYPDRKIFVVFQPHLYSRTKQLFPEFIKSFSLANEVVLVPIYAAREPFDPSISSTMLAEALVKENVHTRSVLSFDEARSLVQTEAQSGDVIIIMGAGDITTISEELARINE